MIAFLQGEVIELDFHDVTVLTSGGVGYGVLINELTYAHLSLEERAQLYIYHHRTENSEALFWFLTPEDKKVFSELIKISGVWGKVAMQILSLGISRLMQAVSMQDNKTIESIKGIGKKMAEKIILELKDKDFWMTLESISETNQSSQMTLSPELYTSIKETLTNMWYAPKDVEKILQNLPEGMEDAGEIIPYAIRELS